MIIDDYDAIAERLNRKEPGESHPADDPQGRLLIRCPLCGSYVWCGRRCEFSARMKRTYYP